MSPSTRDSLRPVLDALEVLSPTAFRLSGRVVERHPETADEAARAEAAGAVLVPLLQDALYAACYARPFGAPEPRPDADEDLVPTLTAAHPGRDRWETGWRVKQALSTGRIVAERNGELRFLWPGEFVAPDGPGIQPRPGVRATLWRPRESATLQPGFYYVFGEASGDEDAPLLRLYWNVRPEGAPALVREVAGALNRWELPFRFKCLSRRALYPRVDAAVLYVARRFWPLVSELVAGVHRRVEDGLDDGTPLFALPVARGAALAEDPGNGDSFGRDRCRRVAEGVWEAWRAGAASTDARLDAVADAFRRGGLDLERPWLAAGSAAAYAELA
ncbi:MAG TPA: T3SS effector HopA1 family protein [Longimicrobium sp.]|nr:T3SS effector HopA1 family protein [Longimicrobium sp.]